jgi:hypothetical protein
MAASLVPGFILIIIAKAGKGDRPCRRHSACLEVVAQVFEDNRLIPLLVAAGELDQGLQEAEESPPVRSRISCRSARSRSDRLQEIA